MDKWEDVFKAIKELPNGERIKLLDKMYDEYYDNRPPKEVLEKEKYKSMYGEYDE